MERTAAIPAVTATPQVGAGRARGTRHVDVIYVLGPDCDPMEGDLIRKACDKGGLSYEMIGNGERRITASDIHNLVGSKQRGPDTHVFISGHGSMASGYHTILKGDEDDVAGVSTTHLIGLLLTDPDDAEPAAARPSGSGMIHVMACGAGSLKTEFTPDNKTWRNGWCLVHASTKTNAMGTILPNALAIIELLGCPESKRLAPEPQRVLAEVLAVTGECVTLLGGTLNEAQTYHAPKSGGDVELQNTLARTWQDHLEKELLTRQGRLNEFEAKGDQFYASKLQNTFLTRVRRGDLEAVRALLAQDKSLAQATSVDGLTCLMYASDEGHVAIVDELIARGAKINAAAGNRMTALHCACRNGHAAVARRLVEHGADVNFLTENHYTPVLMACASGAVELANFLLVQKARFDIPNVDGLTSLMAATGKGVPELVKLLLNRGADCNAVDTSGDTALHHACHCGHAAVTTLLLQSDGIDKNIKNNAGFTPLFLAVRKSFEDIAAVLVEGGADLNIADGTGRALLHHACQHGDQSLATLLLRAGRADINVRTPEGETPLSLACANGCDHVVSLMVSYGADINLVDNIGRTPLMRAALATKADRAAKAATLKALIAEKADLDAQDLDGSTALMHACWGNDLRTVSALLDAGASKRLRDVDGKSAFDLVQMRLRTETRSKHVNDLKKIRSLLIFAAVADG